MSTRGEYIERIRPCTFVGVSFNILITFQFVLAFFCEYDSHFDS